MAQRGWQHDRRELTEQEERAMGVTLRRVREEDLEKIMNWRMDPDITRYMNTNPDLNLEKQKRWYRKIQEDPDVSYYMILVDGKDAGVLNLTGLTREDGVLGWAYYVGERPLRSLKTALTLEMGVYDYIFDVLHKKALVSDVFSLNRGVISLHLMCGCEITEEKKAHVVKEGQAYDVTFLRMTAEHWEEVRAEKPHEKLEFPA